MADIVELRPRRPVPLPAPLPGAAPGAAPAADRPAVLRRAPSPRLAVAAMAAVWMAPLAMALPLVLLAKLSAPLSPPSSGPAAAAAPAPGLAELLREATCASTVLCREPAQRLWAVGHPDPALWHITPAVPVPPPATVAAAIPAAPSARAEARPASPAAPPAAAERLAPLPPDRLATLLPPDKAAAILNRRPDWESAALPPAEPARAGGLVTRLDSSAARQVLARSPTRLIRPAPAAASTQPLLRAPVQAGEVIVTPRQLPAATERTVRWSMDTPAAQTVDLAGGARDNLPRRSIVADGAASRLQPAPRWTAEQRAARRAAWQSRQVAQGSAQGWPAGQAWSRPIASAPDASSGQWAARRAMRDSIPREGAAAGATDARRLWAARRMRQTAPKTDG